MVLEVVGLLANLGFDVLGENRGEVAGCVLLLLLFSIHFNFFYFWGVRKVGREIGGRGELKFQLLRVGGF